MKKYKILAILSLASIAAVSCQTTYDAYGNPRQTVDPTTAVAGIAAAGILGYALSDDDDNKRHHRHHPRVGDRRFGYYDRSGRWHWYR